MEKTVIFYSGQFFSISILKYPIVKLTFHRDPCLEEDDVNLLFQKIKELYQFIKFLKIQDQTNPDKITLVIDTYGLQTFQPLLLKTVITFINEIEPETNQNVSSLIICIYSIITKKIVDFIYLFKKTTIPWIILSSEEEFQEWYQEITKTSIISSF
jgi:hypothetical protein